GDVPRSIAQGLFTVEGRQWRGGAEQADQIDTQARPQLPMLMHELHLLDIDAGKPHARIGPEFQVLVQRLLALAGVGLAPAVHDRADAVNQAVYSNSAAQTARSRCCNPVRGVHWYRAPWVVVTRNSWKQLRLAYSAKNSLSTLATSKSSP